MCRPVCSERFHLAVFNEELMKDPEMKQPYWRMKVSHLLI